MLARLRRAGRRAPAYDPGAATQNPASIVTPRAQALVTLAAVAAPVVARALEGDPSMRAGLRVVRCGVRPLLGAPWYGDLGFIVPANDAWYATFGKVMPIGVPVLSVGYAG